MAREEASSEGGSLTVATSFTTPGLATCGTVTLVAV
jgi:hypothetical protein